MTTTDQETAVRFLLRQHEDVRRLFRSVQEATGEARRESFEPLVRLLAVHETAEEMVVYPALRTAGDEGRRIAEARLAEEDEAKKVLADLEKLDRPPRSSRSCSSRSTPRWRSMPRARSARCSRCSNGQSTRSSCGA